MEPIKLCRINQATIVNLREQCSQPRLALKGFDFEDSHVCSWLTRLVLQFDLFATRKTSSCRCPTSLFAQHEISVLDCLKRYEPKLSHLFLSLVYLEPDSTLTNINIEAFSHANLY